MLRRRFAVLISVMALVPTMLIAAPAAAQDDDGVGTITVIHGIPDVDVDVYVDGDLTLETFEYLDVAGPLDLPAADYEVEVTLAGTDTTVLGPETVALAAGANATIVAYLDYEADDDSTPQLGVFVNDTSQMGSGNSRVAVRHLADAPAVDVLTDGTVLVDALANPDEDTITVPAGTYPITIAADADNDVVVFEGDLEFKQGYTYAAHAVGSLDDDSFEVIVQEVMPFIDIADNQHADAIVAIAASGITRGCNPPANNEFCPTTAVTRGQMAAFIVRALEVPLSDEMSFSDIGGHVFERDINALAEIGVARGYDDGTFRPNERMTRGQMAAFLNRAFRPGASDVDRFTDDNGNIFEDDINAIAAAGFTRGCNPPTNDNFCPRDPIQRAHMATFLSRALELF